MCEDNDSCKLSESHLKNFGNNGHCDFCHEKLIHYSESDSDGPLRYQLDIYMCPMIDRLENDEQFEFMNPQAKTWIINQHYREKIGGSY